MLKGWMELRNMKNNSNMKYGLATFGIFVLLFGTAGAYAYSNSNEQKWNMMGNYQGAYNGMMNGNANYRNMMNNYEYYSGMMGNIDIESKDRINALHDQMIKNLDPETAKQMDAMHDSCMGNTD